MLYPNLCYNELCCKGTVLEYIMDSDQTAPLEGNSLNEEYLNICSRHNKQATFTRQRILAE